MEDGDQLEKSNIPREDEVIGDCIGRDKDVEAADDFERRHCSSPIKIASLPTEKLNDEFVVHEKQNSSISAGEMGTVSSSHRMEPNSHVHDSMLSPLSEHQEAQVRQCESPHSSSHRCSPSHIQMVV